MIQIRTSVIGGAILLAAILAGCKHAGSTTQPAQGTEVKDTTVASNPPALPVPPAPPPAPVIQPAANTLYVTEFKPGDTPCKSFPPAKFVPTV